MAKSASKKKGASRNTRPATRKGVPGWLWLVLGLTMGIFVAFLWHLWDLNKGNPARRAATAATTPAGNEKPEPGTTTADGGKQPGKEPRFEFYTLLPNQQVMPGKADNAAPATPATPKAPASEPSYVLQAGAFKSEAEADKRRAAILMLGLPVKIVKVPNKPGETWYRVVVGPFAGKAAAQSARASLKGSGVDTMMIKQG